MCPIIFNGKPYQVNFMVKTPKQLILHKKIWILLLIVAFGVWGSALFDAVLDTVFFHKNPCKSVVKCESLTNFQI